MTLETHIDLGAWPVPHVWLGISAEDQVRVGTRAAGRALDGRTWDEYPKFDPGGERPR